MAYQPTPADKFSFGLWTVGHMGRDPFGEPTREWLDPYDSVMKLGELGAWGVSFHDDDLLAPEEASSQRSERVRRFSKALDNSGVTCSMATTNLFSHPMFREGALTANDRDVRRRAVTKVMDNLDVAAELGAPTYVMWGGREGTDSDSAKDVVSAMERYKEGIDILCQYVMDRGYEIRFALEPKPNEPRGDIFLPTIGHALGLIAELEHPEMVGLNPEVGHEQMAGLNFHHGVAQAIWSGKLFHIDLNGQKGPRYDQDFRFGSEGQKEAFFLVDLLTRHGYEGPRHFDCRAYRTENIDGVWEFAAGCMRNYLILAERAEAFGRDPEVVSAREAARYSELAEPTAAEGETPESLRSAVRESDLSDDQIADRAAGVERVDQLMVEWLLGARS